ncbi:sialoadhesin-like, partial [Silurus meridionalis]
MRPSKLKPKPTVRSDPRYSIKTEDTITLSCELPEPTRWDFFWYKNKQVMSSLARSTNTLYVSPNNAGETMYQCSARCKRDYNYCYTVRSDPVKITVK